MSQDGAGEEPRDDDGRGDEDAGLRHAEGQRPRPGEEELFAALDRTRADLAAAPVPPLPAGFAASLQDRLAAERAAAGRPTTADDHAASPVRSGRAPSNPSSRPPSRPGGGPSSRPGSAGRGTTGAARRRRRVLTAALGALVVVATVTGVVLAGGGTRDRPAPTAAPTVPSAPTVPRGPAPVSVSAADPVRALRAGLGAADPGPLADPARRADCLAAHGLPAGTVPIGTRQVVLDGRPGTLLVLTTGVAARFRVLVVGPDCTADRPDTLADLTVGG